MSAPLIINQLFAGVVSGAILVFLALGLTLIFGLMSVINFAHGSFFMLGAYVGFVMLGLTRNFWPGVVVVPLAIGLLGIVVERTLIKPLYARTGFDTLLVTFGLTYVTVEAARIIWGKVGKPLDPPPELKGGLNLGLFTFPTYLIFLLLAAVVVIVLLYLLLERTDIGLVIRGGTQDSTMVQVLGIDFARARIVVFALGTALAGLGGVLAAPIQGVNPDLGQNILIMSFVVVVVGGMGSFWGAVASGLLIGVVVSMTGLWFPPLSQIVVFVLMAVVLLLRPRGLFGRV